MTVAFEPSALHAAIAAAGAAAGAWFLMRSAALPREVRALRAAALGLLVLSTLRPTAVHHREEVRRAPLPVLIDVSDSMRVRDAKDQPTRLERAKAWIAANDARLRERAEPYYIAFAETPRSVAAADVGALEPAPTSKNLEAALEEAAALGRVGEAWVLSDGVDDRSPGLELALQRLGMALSPLGVGDPRRRRGLGVQRVSKPDYAFQHLTFDLRVDWEAVDLAGQEVALTLRRLPKQGEGGVVLERRAVRVDDDYEIHGTTIAVRPNILGANTYALELRAGGVVEKRELAIDVLRQKWRVMYLSGRPSTNYSQLRAFLKSNPNYELVSFVILREREDVVTFPDDEMALIPFPANDIFTRDIDNFDLFILENFAYWKFNLPKSYLESIKRFVRRGGGFLMIGGDGAFAKGGYRGTPLEEILPVALSAAADDYLSETFTPKLARPDHPMVRSLDARLATEKLWAALPPLAGAHAFGKLQPGAQALVVHPTRKTEAGEPLPVFALKEVGLGKVLVMASPSTWRWKLAGGKDYDLSNFYGGFWSRAIQYLTGSLELEKVRFAKIPPKIQALPPVEVELFVFDEDFRPLSGPDIDVAVQWTGPGGKPVAVPAQDAGGGVYRVELEDLKPGAQKLSAVVRRRGALWGRDNASFTWEDAAQKPRPLNRSLLTRVAQLSGGRYDALEKPALEERLARLPEPRRLREVASRRALWDRPWGLILLAALLLAEWYLRRKRGFL